MDRTQEARERFARDLYATETTGITIESAEKDHAVCRLRIGPGHLNANGVVMGGALFTLADFAFAVASNTDNPDTVSLTSQISFLASPKGQELRAEARCLRAGRRTTSFLIEITDELGTPVASVSTTGLRL